MNYLLKTTNCFFITL